MVAELTELIKEGRARIIGLVRQELLSGIKSPRQYEKLRATLRSFPDEPLGTPDYEAAAKAGNECRLKGAAVSVVDVLICAIALTHDWAIFTADPDFRIIPRCFRLSSTRRGDSHRSLGPNPTTRPEFSGDGGFRLK
jgi:predicted nucleic acid-binding protein